MGILLNYIRTCLQLSHLRCKDSLYSILFSMSYRVQLLLEEKFFIGMVVEYGKPLECKTCALKFLMYTLLISKP